MAAEHDHDHRVIGTKLRTAFFLTVVILVVELVGGLVSHSLALLSDAGHVLTDIIALGLAWFASRQAERPADARRTYGYQRTGILAALLNSVTLIVIVAAIAYEAVRRFSHPEAVTPWLMFVSATVGIAVNLYIGFGLRAEGGGNLNVRAAMLHVFGDIGASVGVIVGGVIIAITAWYPVDPLISLFIAVLIAKSAWGILRETVNILMEAAPRTLNVEAVGRDIAEMPGVSDVHDLHIWTITGGLLALSAHVQVQDRPLSSCEPLRASITNMLQSRYRIGHATIQFECIDCGHDGLFCSPPQEETDGHDHQREHEAVPDGVDIPSR